MPTGLKSAIRVSRSSRPIIWGSRALCRATLTLLLCCTKPALPKPRAAAFAPCARRWTQPAWCRPCSSRIGARISSPPCSLHHFLGEEDICWLAQFKVLHLSDEEARALVVAREANAIDNATYRALNKVDTLTASSRLRRLRDAGLFGQQGRGSATWYLPTERLLGALSSKLDELSSKPPLIQHG